MSEVQWTKTWPTVAGWYWTKRKGKCACIEVRVNQHGALAFFYGWTAWAHEAESCPDLRGLLWGPKIEEPA